MPTNANPNVSTSNTEPARPYDITGGHDSGDQQVDALSNRFDSSLNVTGTGTPDTQQAGVAQGGVPPPGMPYMGPQTVPYSSPLSVPQPTPVPTYNPASFTTPMSTPYVNPGVFGGATYTPSTTNYFPQESANQPSIPGMPLTTPINLPGYPPLTVSAALPFPTLESMQLAQQRPNNSAAS